ncbi:choice-of-anchor D domain-containing protein [uncultured Psychroserpens sp.]|uniref:choice-of-anchor D domain-containing protein n=1 Tax=uncultured Psychroserpens sp. TaxID=255436 RepID=UPI002613D178|nr:choice-of-anchor D domain-containing protein [uncultured Psychroserpens sp.]
MKKNYSLILIAFLCLVITSYAQVTTIDFETLGAGYTPSTTFGTGNTDTFNRTGTAINGNATFHWAAEDISGNPSITLDQIDVTGSTSFTFAVDLSYDNAAQWDATDELLITYSIDGGAYQNLMAVQHINTDAFNNPAALDLDFNGNGDPGQELSTTAFTTFTTSSITLTANTTLDIDFQFNNLTSNGEGILIDNIVITESGGSPTPTITASPSSLSGFTYVETFGPSAEQSFDVSGSDLTNDIIISPPTNWEISTVSGGPYQTTAITLNQASGTVANTTIYTRLVSGLLNVNSPFSGNVTCTSTGATTRNIGLNGTVTLPVADVVITEIMYNPPAANDYEWIEICNLNGTAQDVSDYTIDVNGTTRFTFPSSTTIPANSCITVLLGHLSSSPAPECPFTPDYSNPIGATNFLTNGGATITLETPTNVVADSVAYDDADSNPTNGNGSSFHVIDATADNSDTDTNWQAVLTGGSPGDNTLISPCTAPEIQLVDASNTDQACGFAMAFGSQATGFDTDLTFDIDNDGASDLTVSSMAITGAAAGDYSIISPATPFVVTAGNTQTVTVRFTPSALGSRSATLTINNDDSDESACTIILQGTGTSPTPEINVEGDIGAFPDIADGDTTPSGTDNTLFAAQFIGSSQEKTFRIQNTGTDVLNISNITVGGTNPGDFTITVAPASSIAISGVTIFEVSFSPLAAGVRQADIIITNDDNDEGTYNFRVQGTGNCVANAISLTPTSGPEGTIVTVTGTDLSSATASFNGLAATVNNISNTVMEVTVPSGALTGNLEITDNLGCPGNAPFTVIDNQIGTCEGGSALGELFMSEVTDATYGSLTYIEIYNATGANVNLANYEIRIYANGSTSSFTSQTLSGTINAGDTFVVTTGTSGVLASALCATPGGDGTYGDLISSTLSGVNVRTNEHDFIGLYNTGTLIDAFGEFGVNNWMNSTAITGDRGFNFRRLNTATPIPTTTFDTADWNIIDWAGSGMTSCVSTNDYTDIGIYDFSTGVPPSITLQPNLPSVNCDFAASISVTATEGFSGGNTLAYQWYFAAPSDINWTAVTNGATYSGATLATLDILNTLALDGYQYYCQVREDDATCYTASNAVKLNVSSTTWYDNAGTLEWSNGAPGISTIAVIDANYNTSTEGSFSACQLIVNASNLLTITNNFYVEVENNLTVNGNILVETDGSFVQNNDSGIVDGAVLSDKTRITVEKETAILNSYQEYTYWSSPVSGEIIGDGLSESEVQRRFWYNGQNFRDSTQETNNDNTAVAGQDDIDDDANDWQYATAASTMLTGVGYASTHDAIGYINPARYKYTFEGPFNNGVYNVPIYRNDAETNDNNWNFIGNPYPSAIDADLFLAANASIDQTVGATSGAIFFWSHNTAADGNTNGNEVLNYSQSDYAIINGTGATAGGDGVVPARFIPSGQGFFVSMTDTAPSSVVSGSIRTTDVIFNNSMRVTGNNNQFFRTSNINTPNKIRLDLTSDNGVFNQILIGYIEGATDDDDGMYFDAHKNLSANANSLIYSLIDNNSNKKYAIQGKASTSLSLEEVIPLGFYTIIEEPTIYTLSISELEGNFMTQNTVYLKDYELDTTHDLSANDYSFTSETGEFNDRFEIVFQPESLSVNENEVSPNDVTIVELSDGSVKISVGTNLIIKNVEIIDVVGRTIYKLEGNSNVEIYNLSRLSQATYIAKVTLSNGQTISKKAVKRQ